MPYIEEARKKALLEDGNTGIIQVSDLAYLIAKHVDAFFDERGLSYQTYAEAVGALETLKLELAHRFQPYEDQKRRHNGDVLRNTQQP